MSIKTQNRSLEKYNTKASDKTLKSGQRKKAKKSKQPEIIQKLESHENTPQAIAEDNTKITTRAVQYHGPTKKRSNSNPNAINSGIKKYQTLPSSFSSSTQTTIKKEDFSLSKTCSKLSLEKPGQNAGNKIQILSEPKPHSFQQEEKEIEELEESLKLLDYLAHSTRIQLHDGTADYDFTQNTHKSLVTPAVDYENSNVNRDYQWQYPYQGRKRRGFTTGAIPKEEFISRHHMRQQSDDSALRINKQHRLHIRSGTAQTLPHIIVQGAITNETFPPLKPIKRLPKSHLSSSETLLNGTALSWYSEDAQSYSMQRKDSGLSMTFDTKYEELIKLLEHERIKVKKLEKEKQAVLKDLDTVNQNFDRLKKENIELKKKHGNTNHTKCQTTFLFRTEKSNKLADKTGKPKHSPLTIDTDNNNLLKKQLESTQLQVMLLKSTMQEFLRMGIFNDQLLSPLLITPTEKSPELTPISVKNKNMKQEEQKGEEKNEENYSKNDLDIKLNQLLSQKEILQSEYNRLPSSNKALARKQRDEYEAKLDQFDSEIYSLKFKMRNKRNSKCI